ncbi:MAG TPA: FtsQ-type POTRA domain-containing protein [Polyangia bacterium]|nr:FtsQ-type POTRA domain-containing protein [Polyangia bacterium]
MRNGAGATADPAEPRITVEHPPVKRRLFRRRSNRRITVARPSISTLLADALQAAASRLAIVGKALVVAAFVAGVVWAGRQLVRHVIASPRFAVRDIEVGPSARVSADEIRDLAGVHAGDRLLAVDPDAVAARLATHPWILSARVRRQLPSTLAIEVTERRAVASAMLGALYLLDGAGRPFKRASFAEADGLPVITGVTRDQYASVRVTSEAVFRQVLGLYATYADGHPERPKLSEIHVDTRAGFSLVLYDGGGDIRLGRGDFEAKLARFDRIFAALGPRGPTALKTVYLDGPLSDRVAIRMAAAPEAPGERPTVASEKPHPARKRPEPPAAPQPPASDED